MAAVADDLSQHERWLAHYQLAEKRHARWVMLQKLIYRTELALRRLMRFLRRVSLLAFRLARRVASFTARTTVFVYTSVRDAVIACFDWLRARALAFARLSRRWLVASSVWLAAQARALAALLARWSSAARAWTRVHAAIAWSWIVASSRAIAAAVLSWLVRTGRRAKALARILWRNCFTPEAPLGLGRRLPRGPSPSVSGRRFRRLRNGPPSMAAFSRAPQRTMRAARHGARLNRGRQRPRLGATYRAGRLGQARRPKQQHAQQQKMRAEHRPGARLTARGGSLDEAQRIERNGLVDREGQSAAQASAEMRAAYRFGAQLTRERQLPRLGATYRAGRPGRLRRPKRRRKPQSPRAARAIPGRCFGCARLERDLRRHGAVYRAYWPRARRPAKHGAHLFRAEAARFPVASPELDPPLLAQLECGPRISLIAA